MLYFYLFRSMYSSQGRSVTLSCAKHIFVIIKSMIFMKNFIFLYISEDDSEIELKHCTSSHGLASRSYENIS